MVPYKFNQKLYDALTCQNTQDFINLVPYITSETVIDTHIRFFCSREKKCYYPVLSFVASFGNFEMFKALIDAGITLPPESSREKIKNKNMNQTNPFHDESCFLVAENIIDDFDISFAEFFYPNCAKVLCQEDYDRRYAEFCDDRYKMLYYAFCAGYKCNQCQFREVLRHVSNVYLEFKEQFVKILVLMMYFRIEEDSDPFYKDFSLLYNVDCADTRGRYFKVPQYVRDMVFVYEECWDNLLLLYCLDKRSMAFLF